MSKQLFKGTRVKLTSRIYGDVLSNPVWGGDFGKIAGTIKDSSDDGCTVNWDNGKFNSYTWGTLERIEFDWDD